MNLTSALATHSHPFHNDFTFSSHPVLHPVSQRCHIDFKNIPHQCRTNFFTSNFTISQRFHIIFTTILYPMSYQFHITFTSSFTTLPRGARRIFSPEHRAPATQRPHHGTGHRLHTGHRAPGTGHRPSTGRAGTTARQDTLGLGQP